MHLYIRLAKPVHAIYSWVKQTLNNGDKSVNCDQII